MGYHLEVPNTPKSKVNTPSRDKEEASTSKTKIKCEEGLKRRGASTMVQKTPEKTQASKNKKGKKLVFITEGKSIQKDEVPKIISHKIYSHGTK